MKSILYFSYSFVFRVVKADADLDMKISAIKLPQRESGKVWLQR
jgi:hypothetical protein